MTNSASGPTVSVVLNTYNRAAELAVAVDSVLAQQVDDWQLVVVDDGSTDGTADHLATLSDERVVVIHHDNMGLTASRNAGAAAATGTWLAFLDDDDTVEPHWLSALLGAAGADVGIVFCGHQRVTPDGRLTSAHVPQPLGPMFLDRVGSYWPGTWIMRRDVFEHCGGYLDGLPFIHQFELLLRAVRSCATLGLTTTAIDDALLRYTVREERDRPMQWPQLALDGGRWVLTRHADAFRTARRARADHEGVVGVAAARSGRLDLARRHLARSVRAEWTSPKRWARLVAAVAPWSARRAWRAGAAAGTQLPPLPKVHALPAAHRRGDDHLFLPWGYRCNPQASADNEGTPYWENPSLNNVLYQEPVYREAARLMRRNGWTSVLDVGTGSGVKLQQFLLPVAQQVTGLDQGSGIELARRRCPEVEWIDGDLMLPETWAQVRQRDIALTICADVVEHVDDPMALLRAIAAQLSGERRALISTPDRARLERAPQLGPPTNPRHVREWSADEFELLLESAGLQIVRRYRFLPRGYRPTVLELKRLVWRVLHRRAIPDRRTNIAYLCRVAGSAAG